MPDSIVISISDQTNANLLLSGYNNGQDDPNIYFKALPVSGEFELQPTEIIRAVVIPSDNPMTTGDIDAMLSNHGTPDDTSQGIYFTSYKNDTSLTKTITELPVIKISDRDWENTKFDLHWRQELLDNAIYDNYLSGIYSYPHNIQPQEVSLDGELIDNNTKVRYTVGWNAITNEGHGSYDASEGPYMLSVFYRDIYSSDTVTATFDSGDIIFSGVEDYEFYGSGVSTSGITFDIPFYDQRPSFEVPAAYILSINNHCVETGVVGAIALNIPLDHQTMKDEFLVDLDTNVSTNINLENLQYSKDIEIERGTIDRRRLSIGVKDVSVSENTYSKKGIYISPSYQTEFDIYTFSLKVDEFIPPYPDINPNEVVKYYIEFNGRPWERISPIHRNDEFENNKLVPKMFIFDKESEEVGSQNIRFLDYEVGVDIFRIKIVIDATELNESRFIPPEVRDYKCLIFNKNNLMEL